MISFFLGRPITWHFFEHPFGPMVKEQLATQYKRVNLLVVQAAVVVMMACWQYLAAAAHTYPVSCLDSVTSLLLATLS